MLNPLLTIEPGDLFCGVWALAEGGVFRDQRLCGRKGRRPAICLHVDRRVRGGEMATRVVTGVIVRLVASG